MDAQRMGTAIKHWLIGNVAWVAVGKLFVAAVSAMIVGVTAFAERFPFPVVLIVALATFGVFVWAANGVLALLERWKKSKVAAPDEERTPDESLLPRRERRESSHTKNDTTITDTEEIRRHRDTTIHVLPGDLDRDARSVPAETPHELIVVANGMNAWPDTGGVHEGSYHVLLPDVLITNTTPNRMSLMASMDIMVRPGSWGPGGHIRTEAETQPYGGDAKLGQWLYCPLHVEPRQTVRGHMWFTINEGTMINVKGDPREVFDVQGRSNRLVLREMVSAKTYYQDVPTLRVADMDK